jgi:hypothetical protein
VSQDVATTRRISQGVALLGFALIAAWAVPLLVPPPAQPLVAPETGASLVARLFPGVPPAWVMARLAALAAGAALLAASATGVRVVALPRASGAPRVRLPFAGAALGLAALLAVFGVFGAARLSHLAQPLFVMALFAPSILLSLGADTPPPSTGGRAEPRASARPIVVATGLAALWLALRLPLAWRSPRSASLTDLWAAFGWLVDATATGRNVLVESGQPGIANGYMLLLGSSLLGPAGFEASFPWLQVADALWLAGAGVGVGYLASRILPGAAAPVATAVFLASPLVLMATYSASPFGVILALAVALAVALLHFHERRSAAALALLAAVAGLAVMTAYLAIAVAAAGLVAAAILVARRPRPFWLYAGVPLLVFVAAAAPSLPGPAALREMSARYIETSGDWAALQGMLFGQHSPYEPPTLEQVWTAGRPGTFDVVLGSLLSPFAVPRTPLRLWADSLFDPLGGALAAVGLAACLRLARRNNGARALLGCFAVTVLPATLGSAYDRASLTRNFALPVSVALLAAVGLEVIRARFGPRATVRRTAAAVAFAALAGGMVLFDHVSPRLLSVASLELFVESIGGRPPDGGALVLDYGRPFEFPWLHVGLVGAFLPERPIPRLVWTGPGSLRAAGGEPAAELLLYSPALDRDGQVARAVCRAWPGAALYVLSARSGLSEAFAARPAGRGWEPALPAARWSVRGCASVLPASRGG